MGPDLKPNDMLTPLGCVLFLAAGLGCTQADSGSNPLLSEQSASATAELSFRHVIIDGANPTDPHCKTLGDIDGDGFIDAIVASSSDGGMHWYEYPNWTKHTIFPTRSWSVDMQVGDVDADGDLDIIIPGQGGIKWYENPRPTGDPRNGNWNIHLIGKSTLIHDVEVADMDRDGDLDVVTRKKGGQGTIFWKQEHPDLWTPITVSMRDGEGTAIGDVDGDGDIDVAQNGFWVEQVSPSQWTEHDFSTDGPHDVGVIIADINGDGRANIVTAPSESPFGRFSWYETSNPRGGPWTEHIIDSTVSYFHTFKSFDMDQDGDLDLITAEMHQSGDPDEVSIYLNDGHANAWTQMVLANTGSHNIRVGDIGNDGDLDVFGANWNESAPNSAVIEMWENQLDSPPPSELDQWQRHIVETSLPWKAAFIHGKDLNGDNLPDLVVGGWWYPNPGRIDGHWVRTTIGSPLNNMAALHDFDGDGSMDILGTNGKITGEDFSWAQNDGRGNFVVHDIASPPTGGDFLQGVSVAQLLPGQKNEIVLSWHNRASGTSMLSVPADPTSPNWQLTQLSTATNGEQVPVGDIDGDGRLDIHLGTEWLRQRSDGQFEVRSGVTMRFGVPDRLKLTDIDQDGDLDVVIGAESAQPLLIWAENQTNGAGWVEHVIAQDVLYFSMDTGDVDGDGDIDVVGGSHKGSGEVFVYENDGRGAFRSHVVDPGDSILIDHHDGTQFVDIDLDGDLDIISVGWTRTSVVIYENLAGGGGTTPQAPMANAGPNQTVQLGLGQTEAVVTLNGGGSFDVDGEITAYRWSGNPDPSDQVAPQVSLGEGTHLFVLEVEDNDGARAQDSVQIVVLPASDVPPPAGGLVAHWPMREGTGTTVEDITGNGHTGRLINGAHWDTDARVSFDGHDDHIDVGPFDVPGSALTVTGWFFATNLSNCASRDCRILSKATGTSTQDHYIMVSTIASGAQTKLRFRLKTHDNTSTLIASTGSVPPNKWVHMAGVYDGASMLLYQDGQQVGRLSKTGPLASNPAAPFWIGGNPSVATARPWDGKIGDVRVYNRALSAEEVQALANPDEEPQNQPPVAQAGPDQTVQLELGQTETIVTLSGGGSTDTDGQIVAYRWAGSPDPGDQVTPQVSLGEGTHLFVLEVEDNDGARASDSVAVVVLPAPDIPPLLGSLVAHWPMDEGTGTAVEDVTGNGHTGQLVNGARWGTDTGVSFDGHDDHVDVGPFDVPGSALTVTGWFFATDLSNCASRDCRIFSKATGTSTQDHYIMVSTIALGTQTGLRFRLKTNHNTSTLISSTGSVPENEWVHVAAVYDGAAMFLYQDGRRIGHMTKTGALTTHRAVPAWIGGNPSLATARPWDGRIAGVRVYGRALSEAEIQAVLELDR